MVRTMIKNIKISERTKKQMDKAKIHYRETYDDVIRRLLENDKKTNIV